MSKTKDVPALDEVLQRLVAMLSIECSTCRARRATKAKAQARYRAKTQALDARRAADAARQRKHRNKTRLAA